MSSSAQEQSLGRFAQRVLVVVAIVGVALLMWRLSDVLLLTFAGVLLATVFHAISDPIANRTSLSCRWALALVVVGLVTLLALFGLLIGGQIAGQVNELRQALPGAWMRARDWIDNSPLGGVLVETLNNTTRGENSAAQLARFATTTFGALANAVLILFLGLFLAASPELYRRGALQLVPPVARERTAKALDASGQALRRWLLGQFLSMVLVAVLTGLGLSLLGVPLALSLAILAGLLEFVPYIGPIVAAVPAVLIAFTVGPQTALYAALLYFGIQQIEGYAIQPLAQRWAVALPPALTLLAVIIFGVLFGLLGVLFATPLMVVLMVLVQKLYVEPWNTKASVQDVRSRAR